MATTLSSNLTLPVSTAAAYEMVTDPAYLEAVAIATGATTSRSASRQPMTVVQ